MDQNSKNFFRKVMVNKIGLEKNQSIYTNLVGPILALLFAFFAQYIFNANQGTHWIWLMSISENQRLLVGSGFYLLAVIIWIICSPLVNPTVDENIKVNRNGITNLPHRNFRFFLLILSGAIYLINNLLYGIQGENSTIRILWVISIAAFILAQISWPNKSRIKFPDDEKSPPFRLENWIILGLILAFSFWLRHYQLVIIPDDFHGDMASHGLMARDLLFGVEQNIFKFGWANIPMVGFLPAFFSMSIFGNNLYGLQMASVFGGTISIFAVYLLVWRLFDKHRLAAIVSMLLAINIPHIHFSRIAEYIDPWPFGFLGLFFLIDGIRSKRILSFGLSGILIGSSIQMYYSGRVLPIIIAFFILFFVFRKKTWIIDNLYSTICLVAGMLLVVGPSIIFNLINFESYMSRSSEVFLFDPDVMTHSLNKYEVDSVLDVILRQTRETLLMFNYVPDTSTQFGFREPMFNALLSPLIILGIGSAIRRKREIGVVLIFIWLGLMMVLGSILTVDAPFWPRLVGIIPVGAILAAFAIDQILNLSIIQSNQIFKKITTVFFVFLIVYIGWVNWDKYYKSVETNAPGPVFLGRYIQELPIEVTVCSFLVDPPLNVRETSFLAWPRNLVDFSPDTPKEDLKSCKGSSLVWVLLPKDSNRLKDIYQYWPHGKLIIYESPHNYFTYFFYLTGESPPALLPQNIIQTDTGSYKWMYFLVLGGLSILSFLVWISFRNRILRKWITALKSRIIGTIRRIIESQDLKSIIDNFQKRVLEINFVKSVYEYLSLIFSPLIAEFSQMRKQSLHLGSNIKTLGKLILFLFPIGLAYFGQMVLNSGRENGYSIKLIKEIPFSEDQRLLISGFIFLVSSIIWIINLRSNRFNKKCKTKIEKYFPDQPEKDLLNGIFPSTLIFLLSMTSIILSLIIYGLEGETALVRWFWVIGLVGYISYIFTQRKYKNIFIKETSPNFKRNHILLLVSLLIIAFILRIYRLYDLPIDLSTDMASMGLSARDYLMGNENRIFGTGWYYIPRFVFLPYVLSMWLAGNNLFGLYFGTVVMGTLSILAGYLLIWRLFDNHRLAFLTSILVTINPSHINYSRIPGYIDPWFFGFFGLYFLIDGLKSRHWTSFAFSGILSAFAFMSYPSGRAIIPMIGLALICVFLFKREWVKENYVGFVWMLVSFLFVLGPNLIYVITDWEPFMKRAQEVYVFSEYNYVHVRFSYNTNSIWVIIWEQVKRTIFSFNFYNDKSAQFSYPYPIFNPLISPLFVLGFFQALRKWNKPEYLIVVGWFVFIMVTGGILTIDTPTWCRLLPALPFGAFLIAIVLEKILAYFASYSKKIINLFAVIWVVSLLVTLNFLDWKQYIDYASVETRPVVFVGRYIDSLPDEIVACGMTADYSFLWSEIAFLGWPHTMIEVPSDTDQINISTCPGEKLVWILSPPFAHWVEELKSIWPNGEYQEHLNFNNDLMFISYLISGQNSSGK